MIRSLMTPQIVILWVAICGFLIWKYRKRRRRRWFALSFNELVTLGIAVTALLVSLKLQRDSIVPRLQVVPVEFTVERHHTMLTIAVGNYSDFVARNVRIDVKFGTNQWKTEISQAHKREELRQLGPRLEALQRTQDEKKQFEESFLNTLLFTELEPERTRKLTFVDYNIDSLKDWDYFQHDANGRKTPMRFEETSFYKLNQRWKEVVLSSSREPVVIQIRARWDNQIGRKFERIASYRLNVASYGNEHAFTFIPEAVTIEAN